MRFRVLGALEVSRSGELIALGGPKQRSVLALLLIRANRVVPSDELIDQLWGDSPPSTARKTLQGYVTHLRKALGPERLEWRSPGYVVHVDGGELDAMRFEDLLRDARRADQPDQAAGLYREALALWSGHPYADLSGNGALSAEVTRLEEVRLGALEARIAADLDASGYAVDLVSELQVLTAEYPLRERLWGSLMVALYRAGRQADALAAYQRARDILADELGVDPSGDLQQLHEQLLRHDPSLERPHERLRGYTLLEEIGEGSFGVVYRATQSPLSRDVAIKVIRPELANQPDFVRRFEREAQLVARLEHPHIVPLYDYWREPDAAYLVMRFLRGGSLEDLLRMRPLDPDDASRILDQVGAALSAAHQQGIVHRDVKPGNVLLDEDGSAYLSDFGIALETGAPEQTAGTAVPGTPAYLSPEQIRLEPTGPSGDIYSLGVVLYEMLTGQHPFPRSPLRTLLDEQHQRPLPSVREHRPDLPPAIDPAIARATAKDPHARFTDVLELCSAFRSAIGSTSSLVGIRGEARNPYKGLRAFLEADHADYFGRESLTRQLIERFAESGASRFLCVVGPSGSGKSSAVRAGLVPALRRGAISGSDRWYIVDMVPGVHPLRELETALLGVSVEPPPSLLDELERDEHGLARAVSQILPDPDAELVIVLDQLEELFTMVDGAECTHVLESIRAATADPTSRVRVVATLRADFFDQPLSIRGFGHLLASRNEAITPMTPEEVERAIVGPAERVGLDVEPGLVAAMVADVIDRPGALPLLQYALTELAGSESAHALTLSAYRRIGGVSGALARRAERLFDALDEGGRLGCRQLFLRLVTLGDGTEDTRHRVRRSELRHADGGFDALIDVFGRHRLLSFDRDSITREPTVEIAHEALLSAWGRLRGWIDDAREDLRIRNGLALAAAEWIQSDREESFLLRGGRLETTATWRESAAEATGLDLNADEREYLDASIRAGEAVRAAEQARRERERVLERRSAKRLRALVAILAAAALTASGLALIARDQSGRAARASRLARARELAAAAVANLDVDPERSILLALEAVRTTRSVDGTVLPEAEEALHRAVGESRVVKWLSVEAADVEFSPDGSRLATAGDPDELLSTEGAGTPGDGYVYDVASGERELTLSGHEDRLLEVRFSPDGSRLATSSVDGTAAIWDAETGERLLVLPGHAEDFVSSSFSPDGTRLLTTDSAGAVRVWDTRNGRVKLDLSDQGLCGGVLSPDGTHIAGGACAAQSTLIVLDADTGQRTLTLRGHTRPAIDLAYSPDGDRIATASIDGTAKIWDAGTGEALHTLTGHGGWVFGVDFSPDGRLLATAGEDGTARVWDVTSGRQLFVLSGHTGIIADVEFSPDGAGLATSSGDGTVRIWDVRPQGGQEHMVLPEADATSLAYSPDGAWLATTGWSGTATLWDAATGTRMRAFSGADAGIDAAFAPDGKRLVTGGFSGQPIIWQTATAEGRRSLRGAQSWIASVAFSPNGSQVAAGLGDSDVGDGQLLLWEASTGRLMRTLGKRPQSAGGDHTIIDLDYSPDGTLLAAASFDGTVTVWDPAAGEKRLSLRPHALAVSAAFSPDGRLLATAGSDGTVKLWDARTGTQIRTLHGHLGTVVRVAFSPDGARLASAGFDSTARLWDVSTGEQLLVLRGQTLGLTDLEFSPDGTRLATSAYDGTVRVYVLPVQELIDLARSRLTRTWTKEECRTYLHLEDCP